MINRLDCATFYCPFTSAEVRICSASLASVKKQSKPFSETLCHQFLRWGEDFHNIFFPTLHLQFQKLSFATDKKDGTDREMGQLNTCFIFCMYLPCTRIKYCIIHQGDMLVFQCVQPRSVVEIDTISLEDKEMGVNFINTTINNQTASKIKRMFLPV